MSHIEIFKPIILAVLLLLSSGVARAEMWKCTDQDGNTRYENDKAKAIGCKPLPIDSSGVARAEMWKCTDQDGNTRYEDDKAKAIGCEPLPKTLREWFTQHNKQAAAEDLAAKNILDNTLMFCSENSTNWGAVISFGRKFIPFANSRSVAKTVAKALGREAEWTDSMNPDAIVNDFRTASILAPSDSRKDLMQALRNGLEEYSRFYGDVNANQMAINLESIMRGTRSEIYDSFFLDSLILIVLITGLYFLPGVVARARHHYNENAIKRDRMAADQGMASAQSKLGHMYADGQSVTQDYAEAVKWYREAADQGDANAQANLGIMYEKGQGVTQDYLQAHKWFNLAASRQTVAKKRADTVAAREEVASKMTPSQIAEAQQLAREWKPK